MQARRLRQAVLAGRVASAEAPRVVWALLALVSRLPDRVVVVALCCRVSLGRHSFA